jgi:hypothetical protein
MNVIPCREKNKICPKKGKGNLWYLSYCRENHGFLGVLLFPAVISLQVVYATYATYANPTVYADDANDDNDANDTPGGVVRPGIRPNPSYHSIGGPCKGRI